MPLTTGRYAESGTPATLRSRLFWLRHNLGTALQQVRAGLSDNGHDSEYLCRDWGVWMVRPGNGLRSRRWISPPLRMTRSIGADDNEAATEWFVAAAGI
jgi:hypothetical protein